MRLTLPTPGLMIVLVLLASVAGELATETLVRQHQLRREQDQALAVLNAVRARIEKLIYRDLYVVRALATHIATVRNIDQAGFAAYASRLMTRPSALRHVTAAPDLVMRYVYPPDGNEAVVGRAYAAYPAQAEDVARAAAGHGMVISGPVDLVQGGTAFIAREAVLLSAPQGPPRLWGLVSAAIDSDKLYRLVGLTAARKDYEVALRAEDSGKPGASRVFYGDADLFATRNARTVVNLPQGRWVMVARPLGGWVASPPPVLWLVRAAAAALAGLAVVFIRRRSRHLAEQAAALDALARSEAALRRSQQDLINAIESLAEGFALWGQDDCLQVYNQRLTTLLPALAGEIRVGMRFEELIGRMADLGVVGGDIGRQAWIAARVAQHRAASGVLEVHTQTGRTIAIAERRTPDGYVVGLYTDVTELRAAEADVHFRAYFDVLTGLPNREHFMNQLRDAIATASRDARQFALLFIDLDRFKNVNDTLGHEVGDRVLVEAARRLRGSVRHSDVVARFGGDEFTVLLRDIDDGLDAAHSAEAMIAALSSEFDLGAHRLHSGASIGITLFPADGHDPHTLLRNADMAMYRAKARGRNTCRYFAPDMSARAEHFVALERDLRQALAREEFEFEYQPVVRLADGATVGAEALLRWRHPTRGTVPPDDFIPVAEEMRLIDDIGLWGLRRACRDALTWRTGADGGVPRVAVNVSARQLSGGFDGACVRRVLDETGFPPARLVLEITESVLIDGERRVGAVLREFHELGIAIALDDFGTGWSAFGYLRRFPVTMLKIDRGFVHDLEHKASDAHLVAAIVALGRALDITVVAEGVENTTQADILRDMGCELAQGNHFGAPVAVAAFAGTL